MNRDLLLRAMVDWNFWYRDQFTGIPREYSGQVLDLLSTGEAITVLGVKRAGKSTIITQVAKRLVDTGVNPLNILIVNFEDPRFQEIRTANDLFSLYDLYQEVRGQLQGKPYLFLDEIQRVEGWEGFVRSIVDRKKTHVTVSGSTASLTQAVRRSLAGRHLTVEVFPLSFREFLRFRNVNVSTELDLVAREAEIRALFDEYLRYGGFPLVALNPGNRERILAQLYDDIVYRDAVLECRVRNVGEIGNLALFYVSNVGNRVGFRRLSRSMGIPLRNLQRYTDCLRNAYLIFFVKAISPRLREMVKAERKVYSVDNGISNVVGHRLNENLGSLLENLVFVELMRRHGLGNLFYYRGRREVDFVVKERNEIREILQVTYSLGDEREIEGIREFLRIRRVRASVITYDEEGEVNVEGQVVKVMKAWKWLLGMGST